VVEVENLLVSKHHNMIYIHFKFLILRFLFMGFELGRQYENILNVLYVDCSVVAGAVVWLSSSPHAVPKGHLSTIVFELLGIA